MTTCFRRFRRKYFGFSILLTISDKTDVRTVRVLSADCVPTCRLQLHARISFASCYYCVPLLHRSIITTKTTSTVYTILYLVERNTVVVSVWLYFVIKKSILRFGFFTFCPTSPPNSPLILDYCLFR